MSDNQIILDYKGPVDFETTNILLQEVKNKLASHGIKKIFKKRVYSIMVECIENMLRHNAETIKDNLQPYIKLERGKLEYLVTAGNLILNSSIANLDEKLKKIGHSDKKQLRSMYKEQINKDDVLTKNGAGLGFMTIALKSGISLNYEFIAVNEQLSIFELKVTIPIDNN